MKEIVKQVKYETDLDVLERHDPVWNASVHQEPKVDLKATYFKIRHGLMDEKIVDTTKPKVIYAGTET